MLCSSNERDLLLHWFEEIGRGVTMYKEPVLESTTVKFFKEVCEMFEQKTDVFILSIDVVEDFIRAKNRINVKIQDPLLASVTIVFLSHKYLGAEESLKIKHVVDVLFHLTGKLYSETKIVAMEDDILNSLNWHIPTTTALDNLDVVIEKYVCDSKLRVNLRPLCLRILEYLYIEKKSWFKSMKKVYGDNMDCVTVFQNLVCSKVYIPATVFATAVQLCHYKFILDLESILGDITNNCLIHGDHIKVSVTKILELIN